MDYVILNGTTLPYREATLHISDLGLRRGYAAFEFFQIMQGVPLFIEDHLQRFYNSAQLIDLEVPYNRSEIMGFIQELIRINGLELAGIQLVLTGGYSPDAFTPTAPNLIITPMELKRPPEQLYQTGAKVILHQNLREMPEAKTTDYLVAVRLGKRARAEGATETLYHDGKTVSEGGRSSLCIVKNGVLVTAKEGVLEGITRMHLLPLARSIMPVEQRAIGLEELLGADEVMVLGSTRAVMPITQIEDQQVADGKVGPYSQKLLALFRTHMAEYVQKSLKKAPAYFPDKTPK